jgi:uncharacterized protein YbbC (DUF1343 family)
LAEALPRIEGAVLRPVCFEPTFQKWAGQACHGLFVHVTDMRTFRSYRLTLLILRELRRLHGEKLAWNDPPYEYEETLRPIDILAGGPRVRNCVDDNLSDAELIERSNAPADWWQTVSECLLYA